LRDGRLAELDQAVAIAYGQALKDPNLKQEARETAKETLAARHSCGDNRICILDQQVKALDSYSGLGSRVPVPPWVGRYRLDLFDAGSEPPTKNLPGQAPRKLRRYRQGSAMNSSHRRTN
jgi:uncharacterized protein